MTKSINSLSLEQGQTLYKNFLEMPQIEDDSGERKLPVKTKVLCGMLATHTPTNAMRAKTLVESALASRKKIWVWSDTHFGHTSIIKNTNRPFSSADHMNEIMLANYLKVVGPKDLVLFGGDIAFEPKNIIQPRLYSMPGEKILVLGNHDFSDSTYRKYGGFAVTVMSFVFRRPSDGTNILVTHVPIHADLLPENTLNLHGHTHEQTCGPRHICMCVEHLNFGPVLLSDLLNNQQNSVQAD
jgi:calcineurin-like phosphoesterase family protein